MPRNPQTISMCNKILMKSCLPKPFNHTTHSILSLPHKRYLWFFYFFKRRVNFDRIFESALECLFDWCCNCVNLFISSIVHLFLVWPLTGQGRQFLFVSCSWKSWDRGISLTPLLVWKTVHCWFEMQLNGSNAIGRVGLLKCFIWIGIDSLLVTGLVCYLPIWK